MIDIKELPKIIQEENNLLGDKFLEEKYLSLWQKNGDPTNGVLEIYLLGNCKQHCSYCYMGEYGKYLYPANISNYEIIANNVTKIAHWYSKQKLKVNIAIYSAEWVTTSIFNPVMQNLYDAFKDAEYKPKRIEIPDNMLWILDEVLLHNVEDWYNKLKSIGIHLWFSASVDGLYCDDFRSSLSLKTRQEFYDKLFPLVYRYNWNFHPMISPDNIHFWKENYLWWEKNCRKEWFEKLFMLEIRDDSWKKEDIEAYKDFMRFLLTFWLDRVGEKQLIVNILTGHFGNAPTKHPLNLATTNFASMSCSFERDFCIRAGDLSIPMCHRTSYPELMIGHFTLDDTGEIDHIEYDNVNMLMMKKFLNRETAPHCESCIFCSFCDGWCPGASYEATHIFTSPTRKLCEFYYEILTFYFNLLEEKGLLQKLINYVPEWGKEKWYRVKKEVVKDGYFEK